MPLMSFRSSCMYGQSSAAFFRKQYNKELPLCCLLPRRAERRLVVVLRSPVERFFAAYALSLREGHPITAEHDGRRPGIKETTLWMNTVDKRSTAQWQDGTTTLKDAAQMAKTNFQARVDDASCG